ncbi:MAG: hypothetical protein GX786_08155, partial [Clostridiales bacterium]|nr:hypothetical protein [Clostridiales bacterium]
MICEKCGFYMDDEAFTCVSCGAMLKRKPQKDEGIAAIRQGKPSSNPVVLQGKKDGKPEKKLIFGEEDFAQEQNTQRGSFALDQERNTVQRSPRSEQGQQRYHQDAGRPDSMRGLPRMPQGEVPHLRVGNTRLRKVQKRQVNWMKLGLIGICVVILLAVGGYIYLKSVPSGQRLFIRLGGDGPAQAYWQVGEAYMTEGKVNHAIEAFVKADEKQRENTDKKEQDNIQGLLNLAAAYEAAGQSEKGEEIYRYLIEKVELAKNRSEPYNHLIRILLNTDRVAEGAEVMKLAYENTGEDNFIRQRSQTLPFTPEIGDTTLLSGRYDRYIDIPLSSPQGYDIYYVREQGRLAEKQDPVTQGERYTQPIALDKSDVFTIRAVCVNEELVSDPLEITYTISLPLPPAPKATLAPGTYERKQRVSLRHEDMENVTIYYTIDGSQPTTNSPIYKGEPIELPGGRVFLRAMAVNEMGISSNTEEVGY